MNKVTTKYDLRLLHEDLKKELCKIGNEITQTVCTSMVVDILNNMNEFDMTSEILKESLIGKTITKTKTKLVAFPEIALVCDKLLHKWKSIYNLAQLSKPVAVSSVIRAKTSVVSVPAKAIASPSLKTTKSSIDAITITYGDRAENHVGMQKIGTLAESGYSLEDIMQAKMYFEKLGGDCRLIDLREAIKDTLIKSNLEPAYVLIIKNGVDCLLKDNGGTSNDGTHLDMYKEQSLLDYDKKVFMYGQVRNKHARYNLCFSEEDQEPDYLAKKGRIVSFRKVPLTNVIRTKIPSIFGNRNTTANDELQAEGNYYYDAKKCGIGFHGDAERLKVVAVRLGQVAIPLHFQWYHRNEPIGERVKINDLVSGAMYIMSEKATGFDWKRSSLYTLRHAAGCAKFLK